MAVSTEMALAAALSAASGRDGPTVIDIQVDPAGYPAIMDLSRGEAGRRPVPGLPGPGSRAATVNGMGALARRYQKATIRKP